MVLLDVLMIFEPSKTQEQKMKFQPQYNPRQGSFQRSLSELARNNEHKLKNELQMKYNTNHEI